MARGDHDRSLSPRTRRLLGGEPITTGGGGTATGGGSTPPPVKKPAQFLPRDGEQPATPPATPAPAAGINAPDYNALLLGTKKGKPGQVQRLILKGL